MMNYKPEFMDLMNELAIAYGTAFPEDRAELYWEYLEVKDIKRFRRAIKDVIQNSTYFPTIAEIRRRMGETYLEEF